MAKTLTDQLVRELTPPASGNRITYDTEVAGFGARITAAGKVAFVLNYRTRAGRERRHTIGRFPNWITGAARKHARDLKRQIDAGGDPVGEFRAQREAPTMKELCDEFAEGWLAEPKPGAKGESELRPSTRRDYRALIANDILPALRAVKVADVNKHEIRALHAKKSTEAPVSANRMLAVISRLFTLAIDRGYRADNPARGLKKNREEKREHFLKLGELDRLSTALAEHPEQDAANVFRLLLLTGARRGEVLSMRWDDIDLEKGTWTKPSAHTKQKKVHVVPLSEPALLLLRRLRAEADPVAQFVFPSSESVTGHRVDVKDDWAMIRRAAKIKTTRIHDLRHTYASILASAGQSLPIIGALLGHTQAATTQRYAHLFDDAQRGATERAGEIITGAPSADVVPFAAGRRRGQ